jgi:hypothetical protein
MAIVQRPGRGGRGDSWGHIAAEEIEKYIEKELGWDLSAGYLPLFFYCPDASTSTAQKALDKAPGRASWIEIEEDVSFDEAYDEHGEALRYATVMIDLGRDVVNEDDWLALLCGVRQ